MSHKPRPWKPAWFVELQNRRRKYYHGLLLSETDLNIVDFNQTGYMISQLYSGIYFLKASAIRLCVT
jgi:hypothetical protein